MSLAETLKWFKDRGWVFRARFSNEGTFSAEIMRLEGMGESTIGMSPSRGDFYASTINLQAVPGVDPDEVVVRLMRAVEALGGVAAP